MSVLQTIRDKGAIISAFVIGLALLGFILMDAFSGRTGMGGNDTTIGSINGRKVDYIDFQKKIKAQEERHDARAAAGKCEERRSDANNHGRAV